MQMTLAKMNILAAREYHVCAFNMLLCSIPLQKKCAAAKYCCHGYGDRAPPQ